jgi:hypothetical protein
LGLAAILLLGADTAKLKGPFVYPDRWFETHLLLLLEVDREDPDEDYDLLFGPHPFRTQPMRAKISQESDFQVTIEEGFIYMNGVRPYGGTDGGSSTSDGSILVIERTADYLGTAIHRFYFLHRDEPTHKMTVKDKAPTGDTEDGAGINQYVEKIGTGTLSDPEFIEPDTDQFRFIDKVLKLAEMHGYTTPVTWPPP